ncbi:NADPH-dependent FMN reductase [Phyllobacterium sp. TAF24]|uniref:NADPH-dependent FMN reductase n=1 Tax=Phyllobacterium sp. TAF24 TaxID=3233068 RepID=UPI003F9D4FF8
MLKIAVLVGSLRETSINMVLAKALEKLAGSRLKFYYADLNSLPYYNDDLWPEAPECVTTFKLAIESSDAVLFVTPELNRSIPGLLKNAIDWGSRPWGQNSWAGKAASIVGTSPGAIGTAVAQSHLHSIMPILGLSVLGQPEVYLQFRPGLFDDDFNVTDDQTRSFLESYLTQFENWVTMTRER